MTQTAKKRIGIFLTFMVVIFGFAGWWTNKTPTVSVVMPVYNREDLVGRAIESILNQTFQDFEFVIVDDGSSDKTPEIVKAYADYDKRIRFLSYGMNRGVGYARQYGLENARGEFVAVMDSDDWSMPDRLEKSVAFMRDHPEIVAMTAGMRNIKDAPLPGTEAWDKYKRQQRQEKRKLKKTGQKSPKYTVGNMPGFYEVELAFYNSFPNLPSMYRRDFVKKHNIRYQPHMISAEDYDFWRQIAMSGGKMASIHDVVAYVRSHGSNSSKYYSDMHKNSLEIHRQMFARFFTPTKEELKFSYNELEKCRFLTKMIAGNKKKQYLPQHWLQARFDARCPENYEQVLFLEHKKWSSFLVPTKDGRYLRYGTTIKADIELANDQITVLWDGWPAETFKKEGDIWKFVPKGEYIKVKHPDWTDDFIIEEGNKRLCRADKDDCADILVRSDQRLSIKWDDAQWPMESFIYNPSEKIWEFEAGERLKINHPHWQDEFVMRSDNQRVCRLQSGDCARVIFKTDKRLKINWEKPWGTEVFEKNKENVWSAISDNEK